MKHIGLFEGIGGFSLAARMMGWSTIAWCEWNEFGQKILKHHFPTAIGHGDITKTDFTIYRGQCDILTGGFPCQPYSQAGKRLGKEDERHLWPEMLRAIREIQPTWVVGENVSGLVNWNAGMVFDEVQTDLETQGYEVIPFILPACGVNAPHRRDRVWFVAYSHNARTNIGIGINGNGQKENKGWSEQPQFECRENGSNEITTNSDCNIGQLLCGHERNKWGEQPQHPEHSNNGCYGNVANTTSERLEGGRQSGRGKLQTEIRTGMDNGIANTCIDGITTDTQCSRGREIHSNMETGQPNGYSINTNDEQNTWANFPTQSPLCGGNDGLSKGLDGITFPKWRAESIKAYGNAIVPQVAFQIFKAIEEFTKIINYEAKN